jgi:hypothetical protein
MDRDRKIGEKWIVKKLYETERRKKIVDFELREGVMVRYIMPIEAGKKKRYAISPERYIVHGHEGHAYIIMARDGSAKTVPRWRLKPSDDEKYPFAERLGKGNSGIVKKILLGFLAMKKGMYQVKWKVPLGQPRQITWEYPSNIRRVNDDLSEMTPEEESFFKGRTVRQHLGLNYTAQSVASLDGMLDDEAVDALMIHDFDGAGNDAFMNANLTDTILYHGCREEIDLTGKDDGWENLFMPINLHHNHWVLGRVISDTKTVKIYDSMNKHHKHYPELDNPSREAFKAALREIYNMKPVTIEYPACPQQRDGEACGIFMIENAKKLFWGEPLVNNFTKADVKL